MDGKVRTVATGRRRHVAAFSLAALVCSAAIAQDAVPTRPAAPQLMKRGLYKDAIRVLLKEVQRLDEAECGKQFLMLKQSTSNTSTEETSRPKINIVTNWFEELKERVPVE